MAAAGAAFPVAPEAVRPTPAALTAATVPRDTAALVSLAAMVIDGGGLSR